LLAVIDGKFIRRKLFHLQPLLMLDLTQGIGTGIEYINIPVGGELPEAATIQTFNDTMDRLEGKKILIHCQSGNRVGMMWGVYLTSKGAPLDEVLEVVKYSATKEPMLAAIRQYAAETNSATSLCATC